MTLKARVGRHTRDKGRQCQNRAADQRTVIDLLNRIPVSEGGAGGALKGPIVAGISSDALYRAISQFEDKYFPGQRNGFVDPGRTMLKRMEELAKLAAESPLDILRRNLLKADKSLAGKWNFGDRVQVDRLVAMAVKHIDNLKKLKDPKGKLLDKLPSWAELFGRAYVAKQGEEVYEVYGRWVPIEHYLEARDRRRNTRKVVDVMNYGTPLTWHDEIWTWKLPALILFQDGKYFIAAPGLRSTDVAGAHEAAVHGSIAG